MMDLSYEEVMSELEDLNEDKQEDFLEALDSRLERRIQINEEQQEFDEESALERDEPFDKEEFTYFQDTAREAMREYGRKRDLEDLDEISREYVKRLTRTNQILEESGQEAGLMDWLSDLDNLVYSIAESERRTKSQFGDMDRIEEEVFSTVEKFTYGDIRENLDLLEYQDFLDYVDETKEMEENNEFDSEEYIPEDETNLSEEQFDKIEEKVERERKETKQKLEMYLTAVPEEVENRAPHRYREAMNVVRSEIGPEFDMPSMKNIVETDFAAALYEVKS